MLRDTRSGMPPMEDGGGDGDCPAWKGEPFLHYIHRLAQHKGMAPPGPNPHADEVKVEHIARRVPGEDG